MGDAVPPTSGPCCETAAGCIFSKALLAKTASCEKSARRSLAERELIECSAPVARINCTTLAALMHERARFALRLPSPGKPLIHMQALRLQCGGLAALQQVLASEQADVHRMVNESHARFGSLTDLPWSTIVDELVAWQAPRRGRTRG